MLLLDKLQIDDPVGAFPVHGLCGVWGGMATGLFGVGANLTTQLIGTGAIVAGVGNQPCALLRPEGVRSAPASMRKKKSLAWTSRNMACMPIRNRWSLWNLPASGCYPSSSHSPAMAAKPSTEAV